MKSQSCPLPHPPHRDAGMDHVVHIEHATYCHTPCYLFRSDSWEKNLYIDASKVGEVIGNILELIDHGETLDVQFSLQELFFTFKEELQQKVFDLSSTIDKLG